MNVTASSSRACRAGLVLAGGRSLRFGSPKAAARFAGRPLIAWSIASLEAVCGVVAVSAGPDGVPEDLMGGRAMILDGPGHARGPLAGLAAGFAWAEAQGASALFTLPCDTPLVRSADLEAIGEALGQAPAAYAETADGPQGLCAVWRLSLAAPLEAALAGGRHPPVQHFLKQIGARPVWFDDAGVFRNVNRSADLEELSRATGVGGSRGAK